MTLYIYIHIYIYRDPDAPTIALFLVVTTGGRGLVQAQKTSSFRVSYLNGNLKLKVFKL